MKNPRKLALYVLALLLVVSSVAGCSQQSSTSSPATSAESSQASQEQTSTVEMSKEPITFKVFTMAWTTWDEDMTTDPVGKKIIEETGVTLDVETATGDMDEKLNLMLSSGDYPDFVWMTSEATMRAYRDNGAIYEMGPLIEKYGPNIYSQFDGLSVYYTLDDSKLWYIPCFYCGSPYIVSKGFGIRHDIVEEYYPEKADTKSIITIDEFYSMLKDYKGKNPTNANGQKFIGVTGMTEHFDSTREIWGIEDLFVDGNGDVRMYMFNPQEKKRILWWNMMYREGLLDPEIFLNTKDDYVQKLSTKQAVAIKAHFGEYEDTNTALYNEDQNQLIAQYRVVSAEGEDKYYAHNPYGGNFMTITKNCKDVTRATQFLNYLCDPKVNFEIFAGPEGHWWNEVDGKAVVDTKAIEAMPNQWDRFRVSGAYKYFFVGREGPDPRLGDFWTDPIYNIALGSGDTPFEKHRYLNWEHEDCADPGYFLGVNVDTGSAEDIIKQKINDLYSRQVAAAVAAKTAEECEKIFDKILTDIIALDSAKYEAAVGPKYILRKELLDEYKASQK